MIFIFQSVIFKKKSALLTDESTFICQFFGHAASHIFNAGQKKTELHWTEKVTLLSVKRSAFIVMKVTFWTIDKNDRNM